MGRRDSKGSHKGRAIGNAPPERQMLTTNETYPRV